MKTEVDKLLRDIKAKKSGLSCIVATHIAYKKYQCVFQNFHCITEIWPNIQENLKKEKRSNWRTDKGQVSFVFIQVSNLSNNLYLPVRHLEYIFDDNIRLDGEFPHLSKFIVIIIIIMCDYTGTMIYF